MTYHKGSTRHKLSKMQTGETIWFEASNRDQRSPVRFDDSLRDLGVFKFDKFCAVKNLEIVWMWRVKRMQ